MKISFDPSALSLLRALAAGRGAGRAEYLRHLEAVRLSLNAGFDRLLALEDLPDFTLFPHQRAAVRRVLAEKGGCAILADEVGLGKTIDAGVIVREYLVRGLARRVLILVPAGLVEQWRQELREHLHLDFTVPASPAGWGESGLLLLSLDTAKREPWAGALARYQYDVVVVDEAHRLRNRATALWKLVNRLQKKHLLLLTATPIQNNLRELYNLVTLLRPGQLKTFAAFKREFMLDEHSPRDPERLRGVLAQVMVRTRRAEALVGLPPRRVFHLEVRLSPAEQELYRRVLESARALYSGEGSGQRLLLLMLLLREVCSSPRAAAGTLERLAGQVPAPRRRRLLELAGRCRACGPGAKWEALREVLAREEGPAVVYTEFTETQAALADLLRAEGWPVFLYAGGLSRQARARALEEFRRQGGVLISTEAGGEGLNLQCARRVVNYDLPWNPMRVEQRIGRVHRLGQVHPVEVFNLTAAGTVEEHVLYLLDKKVRMFEAVVGELELILGLGRLRHLEGDLGRIFLGSADEEEVRRRLEGLGQGLAAARARYERVRALNDRLAGVSP
ncbi:MAG: DEAD/DEAH box helicase [Bacillota bacterium]|nr:DEAD/DEAH box helicase [Bacillota bacterium]